MGGFFICYRRSDTAEMVGRLYDRLVQRYGVKRVFKDVFSIAPGLDFQQVIDDALTKTQSMLVVIGDRWDVQRLGDQDDPIRRELERGLALGVKIIPLFVRGVKMPEASELPSSLASFVRKNGIPLRDDPDFDTDVERLVDGLAPAVKVGARWLLPVAAAALLGLLLVWRVMPTQVAGGAKSVPAAASQTSTPVQTQAVEPAHQSTPAQTPASLPSEGQPAAPPAPTTAPLPAPRPTNTRPTTPEKGKQATTPSGSTAHASEPKRPAPASEPERPAPGPAPPPAPIDTSPAAPGIVQVPKRVVLDQTACHQGDFSRESVRGPETVVGTDSAVRILQAHCLEGPCRVDINRGPSIKLQTGQKGGEEVTAVGKEIRVTTGLVDLAYCSTHPHPAPPDEPRL